MSNEEKIRLTSPDSESLKKEKSERKRPKCGRCHVHGVKVELSGHKRYCRYQKCNCPKCYIFLKQKRLSADKIALTRAYKLSVEHELLPQEVSLSLFFKRNNNRELVISLQLRKIDQIFIR